MSLDRAVESDAIQREGSLRLLGDPSLMPLFWAAFSATPPPNAGLDVFLSRRPIDDHGLRAAAVSAAKTRPFLWVALVWGRGVVGPLVRPGAGDACVHAIRASAVESALAAAAPVAELALLPGLVAAIAANEVACFRRGGVPASVNGQIHVVPYGGWAAASAPVLTRAALPQHSACPSCAAAGIERPADRSPRWEWLDAVTAGARPRQHPEGSRSLSPHPKTPVPGRQEWKAWT